MADRDPSRGKSKLACEPIITGIAALRLAAAAATPTPKRFMTAWKKSEAAQAGRSRLHDPTGDLQDLMGWQAPARTCAVRRG